MFKRLLLLIILLLSFSNLQAFTQNPNQSVTIYVHGYDPSGYKKSGIFGADEMESFFDDIPTFLGLPTIANEDDKNRPNVVASTTYYGDIAPEYYSELDKQELTEAGDGVPRYALIVAKYAKHLLQRTGAKQVNFISASMGALVTRYLIEKDLESLASTKKIARWMTIEGVVNGNYATSESLLFKVVDKVDKQSIDTEHMKYSWLDKQFPAPRYIGQSPYYKDILIGHESSTKDDVKEHALTWIMLSHGQFQPNDGYQALGDTYFHDILEPYRFYGQNPTHSFLHDTHLGIKTNKSLWVQIGNFLTSNKRVKITLLNATVNDIKEKNKWYAKFLPADVVFESEIFSPAVSLKYGISDAISQRLYRGAVPEIVRYSKNGETKSVNQVIYDDFVIENEKNLNIKLTAKEIDGDVRYDIVESLKDKDYDFIGSLDFEVPLENGVYNFSQQNFSGSVQVEVIEYPFALLGEDNQTDIRGGVDEDTILNIGDLVSYERVLSKDSNFMSQSFKALIEQTPELKADTIYGVDAYKIVYTTTTKDNRTINASGLVTIPKDIDKKISIISDQHGTMFSRVDAPSIHNPITTTGALISSLRGYAVCMPDYIGYGKTANLDHPYQIKNSLAHSTADMIVATKQLLDKLEIYYDDKLYLMGYSEGGYATLATLELLNSGYKNLKVTASAPMAGSYDLLKTADTILAQESYKEIHLPIFLIYSYYDYYALGSLDDIFKDGYSDKIKNFFAQKRAGNIINLDLPTDRDKLYKDTFIQEYFSNSQTPLKERLKENSLIDWTPTMPLRLYHCKDDKVVPAQNSQIAYDSFIANGATDVELILKDGGSHDSCSLPFYIDAIEWFGKF